MDRRRVAELMLMSVLSGCGSEPGVAVQDWMLRDYSDVATGRHLDLRGLYRLESHDELTLELVAVSFEGEHVAAEYELEPLTAESARIIPSEDADLLVLGSAIARPYSGPILGVDVDNALEIEHLNRDQTSYWYPEGLCMRSVECPPEHEHISCVDTYVCTEQ